MEPLLPGYDPRTADLRERVDSLPVPGQDRPSLALPAQGLRPLETLPTWHDRFQAGGIGPAIGSLLTHAMRRERGRQPEPSTAIRDT